MISQAHNSLVDWELFNERYSGREGFINKLLSLAITSCESVPEKLNSAINKEDYDDIAFVAHSLKGVSGNLIADSVYELAKETEQCAREKRSETFLNANRLSEVTCKLLKEIDGNIKS